MLHHARCTYCTSLSLTVWASGEIHSDLLGVCYCPNGHVIIAELTTELFDILYKSAVDAYLKNCLSESVMSFAASLERAYELFTKLILLRQPIEYQEIEKYWKEIRNQSERQYGAFCFCYFYVTKESWQSDNKMVEFRNKVIHKGYIATSEEVKNYADNVTERLSNIIKIIKTNYDPERRKLYFLQEQARTPMIKKMIEKYPKAFFVSSYHPSLLKWNYSVYESVTFEESLKTAKELIERCGFLL